MLDIVDQTVTCGLRTDEASSPRETLSSEHADELVLEFLVSTKEETDLPSTSSDVTSYK